MTIPTFVEVAIAKDDVVATIRAEWEALYALVMPLSEVSDRVSIVPEAGAASEECNKDEWNLKDILAHICWGERWMAGQIGLPVRELPTPDPSLDLADQDQRDAWFYRLDHDRPFEDVLAEGKAIHSALMGRLEQLSEAFLNAPFHVNPQVPPAEYSQIEAQWRPLWPLWRWVVSMTYDRYRQHLPRLQAWFTTDKAPLDGGVQHASPTIPAVAAR